MIPEQLLTYPESEWLDYKSEFHSNTAKLLHDILCLSNSDWGGDRFLVFGVKDDKTICGIGSDPKRKTSSEIQDFIRQIGLNKVPKLLLSFHMVGVEEIAILKIENSENKPFFLIKDFGKNDTILRAGVVYTRLGDTNIPMKGTAPEDRIEVMWRERFGLNLEPLQRFERLLEEKSDWVAMGEHRLLYHRLFPEFTIVENGRDVNDFSEEWTRKFPDPHASSYDLEIRYQATVLKCIIFVSCDGGRYFLPLPERNEDGRFSIKADSIEYKIAELYAHPYHLESVFQRASVKILT